MKSLILLLVCGLLAASFGRPVGPPGPTGGPPPSMMPTGLPTPSGPPVGPTGGTEKIIFEGCPLEEIHANFERLIPAVMQVLYHSYEKGQKFYKKQPETSCDAFEDDDDEEDRIEENASYIELMKDVSQMPGDIIDYIDFNDSDIQNKLDSAVERGLDCDADECGSCAGAVAWEVMHTLEEIRLNCRTSVAQRIVLALIMRATKTIVEPELRARNDSDVIVKVMIKAAKVMARRIRRKILKPQKMTFKAMLAALEHGIASAMEEDEDISVDDIIENIKEPIESAFQCVPESTLTRRTLWALQDLYHMTYVPPEVIVQDLLPRFLPPCDAIAYLAEVNDTAIMDVKHHLINGIANYQTVVFNIFFALEDAIVYMNATYLQTDVADLLKANETAVFVEALSGWDPTRC